MLQAKFRDDLYIIGKDDNLTIPKIVNMQIFSIRTNNFRLKLRYLIILEIRNLIFDLNIRLNLFFLFFFFDLGFLSQTFTNHITAGEGGGHLFISSLPFPPASQTLRH